MPSYYPSVPGPVTRPLDAANAATGNVAGVAAQVTVTGGIGTPSGALAGNVTGAAAHVTVTGGIGTPHGVISAGVVVNQWAATFAQPAAFANTPPALQSTVIALNSSTSVGGGSGVPSAGNWLFCIVGMNEQSAAAGFTAGDADDIHSFWRPGDVTTSTWAVSEAAAKTRTSVWYTANLARAAGDVYVAPNGAMAGMACLVVEVSGIGPWDTVTGINTAYAASARSLALTLAAPPAGSFMIAAVTGDNSSASQLFTPGGWTPLHTVTAANGANHVSDAVLTSAFLPSGSSAVSISASAGTAENLSGVVIAVQLGAPSPIPSSSGVAPGWPGRMIVEAAFGAGFETPADECTWTTLNDSAVTPGPGVTKRFWGWADQGGIPYALAGLQSGTGTVTMDDADGYLTPSNSASPYYPDIVTGTPVRLRVALGTLTGPLGATVVNRWYVVQRNMLDAQEKRDSNMRNYVDMSLTDIWSVASGACLTPYRGEVHQDNPYAWWPMDDQPGVAGVKPTALRNIAAGNPAPIGITYNSIGLTSQYMINGSVWPDGFDDNLSEYRVNTAVGWMWGDPQVTGSPVGSGGQATASPGANAWEADGQYGNTGGNGYFLVCNDTGFPPLSSGVTVAGWFQYPFFGGGGIYTSTNEPVCSGPYGAWTLLTLTTNSNPVAILQINTSGHLVLITYNGSTPTTNTVYTATDLRDSCWRYYAVTLTTTGWAVYINGGLRGSASGTATGMTSAWTYLVVNGDMGSSNGGGTTSAVVHGANVSVSHVAVWPQVLSAARLLAHYCAAITAFGVLPTPTGGIVASGGGYTYDGQYDTAGSYAMGSVGTTFYYPGQCTTVAGAYHSGPSAYGLAQIPGNGGGSPADQMQVTAGGATSDEYAFYTLNNSFALTGLTQASVSCAPYDIYTSGFGASTVSIALAHTATGSGAALPTGPSALGDTVAQRIERLLGYGLITAPNRAIDSTASLLVQAALDAGGQAAGSNINNIVQSDNGWLSIDNNGTLCYRARPHLAADTVVWDLSSAGPAYGYPFQPGQTFSNDPQRVWNLISIQQYSPDGTSLPVVTPASSSAAIASQQQYGPRPLPSSTSYLQSASEIQSQASWYLTQYGTMRRRVQSLTVDAAGYPPAWLLVLGVNVGDLVQVTDQPMQGGPQSTGTYRVSSTSRRIFFGANGARPEGSVTLTLDWEPTSYWS